MLRTSIVLPLNAFKTSPGFCARPPGMFSAIARYPRTSIGGLSSGSALITPKTAAAPDISSFIVSIDWAGLSDRPPESNVMPLPTSATTLLALPDGL